MVLWGVFIHVISNQNLSHTKFICTQLSSPWKNFFLKTFIVVIVLYMQQQRSPVFLIQVKFQTSFQSSTLDTEYLLGAEKSLHLYGWSVLGLGKHRMHLQETGFPHTAEYTWGNGEMSAWEVTQKTPSKGEVIARIKPTHCVIKATWSRNVRGFGCFFFNHSSSCLYLNTC